MLGVALSIVVMLLAAAWLGWQVATWRKTVEVTATTSFPTYGARLGDPHVTVTALNTGKSPVTVSRWGLRFPDGQVIVLINDLPWSAPLPHRLDHSADGKWYIPTEDVKKQSKTHGVRYQDLTAYVELADGRTIDARQRGIGWK